MSVSSKWLERSAAVAGGKAAIKLCQPCAGSSICGVLDEDFVVPVDSLAGLQFGSVFPKRSALQCRADVCVPGHVADPASLCRVAADEALLYRTRRLLQVIPSILTSCSRHPKACAVATLQMQSGQCPPVRQIHYVVSLITINQD